LADLTFERLHAEVHGRPVILQRYIFAKSNLADIAKKLFVAQVYCLHVVVESRTSAE
jgi:hypothetical protein